MATGPRRYVARPSRRGRILEDEGRGSLPTSDYQSGEEDALEELTRLHAVIPGVSQKPGVSSVVIVREATRYIEDLHVAMATKLKELGFVPVDMRPASIPKMIQHIISQEELMTIDLRTPNISPQHEPHSS